MFIKGFAIDISGVEKELKWDQIKLAGFSSRASDMLPKSSLATAQAVGNLILLMLTRAPSSSRDCTSRSAY